MTDKINAELNLKVNIYFTDLNDVIIYDEFRTLEAIRKQINGVMKA